MGRSCEVFGLEEILEEKEARPGPCVRTRRQGEAGEKPGQGRPGSSCRSSMSTHTSGTHWEQLSDPGAASPGHPPLVQNREGIGVDCCIGFKSLCGFYEQLEEKN